MSAADIALSALIAAAALHAVISCVKRKRGCGGCCDGCTGCCDGCTGCARGERH